MTILKIRGLIKQMNAFKNYLKMKDKLFVFDIDNTLSDINEPVGKGLTQTLNELSEQCHVALASGKPSSYIAGMVRQLGMKKCIIIGENGATIMFSPTFPPKDYYKFPMSIKIANYLQFIKKNFIRKFGRKIWIQPNEINLTIFPLDIRMINDIHKFAQKFMNRLIHIYYNKDSVDFMPKGFDKGTAIKIILKYLKINRDKLYVFGDGINDIPMLILTKNSFLLIKSPYSAREVFSKVNIQKQFVDYGMLNDFLKKMLRRE